MISYAPFYKTLKEKGISTYKLINEHNIRLKFSFQEHLSCFTGVSTNKLYIGKLVE